MSEIAIRAQELSKMFRLAPERRTSLKERVVRGRGNKGQEFWALKDATFDVPGRCSALSATTARESPLRSR